MRNPWTKKNPLMSMWLSGANSVMGSARGHATAAAKRQAGAMMSAGAKQIMNAWTTALTPPSTRKKSKTR
jgi:hypothetical protein